jgi:signal transduction histidine kinase
VARRLLEQAMENSGARYAALVLHDGDRLRLAAERAVEEGAAREPEAAAVEETALPYALLRHVFRSQASVTLEDATAAHPFRGCSRWRQAGGISVLCLPVVAAGSAVGVLYLENELAPGCFTPEGTRLAHVLAAQAAIAIANARLFGELGAARDRLHEANLALEQRVLERTRALEANHERLRGLERQLAVDEERRRIMRDLHDGLGSQLFVTLSRVERAELDAAQVSDALRACIADMRLVLEAMGPDSNDFLEAWGNFRFRWDQQLRDAGLAADWQVAVQGAALEVPAPATLQLLRIAQEALTNVLKHAAAAHVTLRLASDGIRLVLAIEDDGRGLPARPGADGRGLANMRARAGRLGAELAIEALPRGTRVLLELPLP